jgi:hypothetical protein
MRWWVSITMMGIAGCALAHERADGPPPVPWQGDSGPVVTDASASCGHVLCDPSSECCNGACLPPGLACASDAGPLVMRCGGLLNMACPTGTYCHFENRSCGIAEQPGTCEPVPDACPDPGGAEVCGCDGHDYPSECEANIAHIDVAHAGACEQTQPMMGVSATPTCAPTDGPAWRFMITNGAPTCGVGGGIMIEVWAALETATPGTVYDLRVTSQGHAALCPAPAHSCLALTGTLTLESFVQNESASFSFDLVDPAGGHLRGDHVTVGLWCGNEHLCG